ncbi:hypothetical protein TWF696_008621 [Orbilia brochopaga]|uniref:Uncharacterized protein n=1 Tax=Orbilia brochopaga TaxID=3140254 RepID=A0AAV9UK54_9PEZI
METTLEGTNHTGSWQLSLDGPAHLEGYSYWSEEEMQKLLGLGEFEYLNLRTAVDDAINEPALLIGNLRDSALKKQEWPEKVTIRIKERLSQAVLAKLDSQDPLIVGNVLFKFSKYRRQAVIKKNKEKRRVQASSMRQPSIDTPQLQQPTIPESQPSIGGMSKLPGYMDASSSNTGITLPPLRAATVTHPSYYDGLEVVPYRSNEHNTLPQQVNAEDSKTNEQQNRSYQGEVRQIEASRRFNSEGSIQPPASGDVKDPDPHRTVHGYDTPSISKPQ